MPPSPAAPEPSSDGGPSTDTTVPPIDCASLIESECQAIKTCQADYCYACNAFAPVYNGCRGVDQPAAPCPDFPGCPPTPPPTPSCADQDESTCGSTPGCHAVYQSFQCAADCKQAPCCSTFLRCADGASADCNADDARCDIVQPYCEPPLVVAVNDVCYEGCVYPDVCQ
jgi:hypothetical protein